MGAVVTFFVWVSTTIAEIALVVASVVVEILSVISEVLLTIASYMVGVTVATITGIVNGLGLVTTEMSLQLMSSLNLLNAITGTVFVEVSTTVHMLAYGFTQFLEIIHFKTLYKIHQVLYLVSADYRAAVEKLYRSFSEISKALGMPAEWLNTTMRAARSVVLDVSAMLGRSYDLAEIGWWTSLDNYLDTFQNSISAYEDHPEYILRDIDYMIVKPAIDLKAGIMTGILSSIDNLILAATDFVDDVALLKRDLESWILAMPDIINNAILPHVQPIFDAVENFVVREWTPQIEKLTAVTDTLSGNVETHKENISMITARLRKPGDLIASVYDLPYDQQNEQINKANETLTKPEREAAEAINNEVAPTMEMLESVREALDHDIEMMPYESNEAQEPIKTPQTQMEERSTWFVGDF